MRQEAPGVLSAAVLAGERMLPVAEPLQPLLPAGGLVRGQVVASRGIAAVSLALALAVEATRAGSWLAVVDVPALGLEATEELGVPLERVVRVDPGVSGDRGSRWAELLAAVVDGFEVIVTRVPADASTTLSRKVQSRIKARNAVLIALGAPGSLSPAVELRATHPRWEGLEAGAGYLRGRRVTVTASGRRLPRRHHAELWLPAADGTIAAADLGEADRIEGVDGIEVVDIGPVETAEADTALAG